MIDQLYEDVQRMHASLCEVEGENERLSAGLHEILAQGETLRRMGRETYDRRAGFTLQTVVVLAKQALCLTT